MKVKLRLFIFLILFIQIQSSFAQKEANNILIQNNAGINFSKNYPELFVRDQEPIFTAVDAVISDKNSGDLLFYVAHGTSTSGVFNKNYQVMNNSSGIFYGYNQLADQTALIIPVTKFKYFAFTISQRELDQPINNALYYHEIDMRLDNGLGDVVQGKKNIKVADSVFSRLTAVPHSSSPNTYWLVSYKYHGNSFIVAQVDSLGVHDVVEQRIGPTFEIPNEESGDVRGRWNSGYLKASPNGEMLALSNAAGAYCDKQELSLFDFDASSGTIFNYRQLITAGGTVGIAFSPDNSKLYASNYSFAVLDCYKQDLPIERYSDPNFMGKNPIIQYDLSSPDENAINYSWLPLITGNPSTNIPDNYQNFNCPVDFDLMLMPDGMIYTNFCALLGDRIYRTAIRIENPNALGFASSVNYYTLKGGNSKTVLIPDFPNLLPHYFNEITPLDNPNVDCSEPEIYSVYPNPARKFLNIKISGRCFQPYHLKLIGSTGQLIATYYINQAIPEPINISHLASASYYAVFEFSDKKVVKKLLKY